MRNLNRVVNYETASLRDDMTSARTIEPPKGGGPYVRGEHTAVAVVSGDHAWNVSGPAAPAAYPTREHGRKIRGMVGAWPLPMMASP